MKFFAPLTLLAAMASQATAAVTVYMTVVDFTTQKSILQEFSTTTQATSAIEVSNWSYSLEQTINMSAQSSGVGAGKMSFNPLSISKKVDGNTPVFFSYMAQGKPTTVTLYFFRSTGGSLSSKDTAYMTLQFRLAAFKTQTITGDSEGPREDISMEYGALQVNYATQQPDGTLKQQTPVGWNKVKNIAETTAVVSAKGNKVR